MARTSVNPFSKQNFLIPESLTHSSGIITAVVYGQNYTASVGTPAANTLFFLYLNSGSLVSTTTVPSTYRVSNPNAILVGAWYSNGVSPTPGWGTFVNIEGTPIASWNAGPVALSAEGGGAGKGSVVTLDIVIAERRGDLLSLTFRYEHTAAGTAGSGRYIYTVPTNIPTFSSSLYVPGNGESNVLGSGYVTTAGGGRQTTAQLFNATGFIMGYSNAGANNQVSSATHPLSSSSYRASLSVFGLKSGTWTNAPLKDL